MTKGFRFGLSSILTLSLVQLTIGCQNGGEEPSGTDTTTLFTQLTAEHTGISFSNDLEYDADFNVFTYRNFYNGGGVALGDVNNDGLLDVYLTSNMSSNKLFLNKGNFQFEDITDQSGTGGDKAWSTGVSMVDINADGLLDIYVCNSGDVNGDNKQNELFINNGDLTFAESAEQYGIADRGYSTHAAFFDYDKDGDLDAYLLNNSYKAIGSFNLTRNERPKRDSVGGDKLYRNDNGRFVDVSEAAGIYGSVIGFGLGVTVGDMDRDGWLDIYVSNDFFERDYLYINNGDGTFKEDLEGQMISISAASMGADMADMNNDGYPEIFVTEMLPEPNERIKTVTMFEDWDKYQYKLKNDYYHQFTRNMFHLNNGDGTFSEIGRLADVEATDWSWAALFFDFDNDGHKDIYVANGIYKDLTNLDYLKFISNEETMKSIFTGDKVDFKPLIDAMPSNRIPNYAFVNTTGHQSSTHDFAFVNQAQELGLATPSHSNGSAYGDLDNDGDLDIIVNNVNMPLFIYRNETDTKYAYNQYLKVELLGTEKNLYGVGAKVEVFAGGERLYQEQLPTRGFQSTVDNRLNFGLGKAGKVDSLKVIWPDDRISLLTDVAVDTVVQVSHKDASGGSFSEPLSDDRLFNVLSGAEVGISYKHKENRFVDFDRDRLVFHMVSTEGPKMASADVNGDGLTDFYIGGAKDQAGKLFIQRANGKFESRNMAAFDLDKASEDAGAIFFDTDGDGDLDLFVASGGNEFSLGAQALIDRLYLNNGSGVFTKSNGLLPDLEPYSSACAVASDYDGDGDMDLFIGARLKPLAYGSPVSGILLENEQGKFKDVTRRLAPGLIDMGMITDALWADVDGDKDDDLVIIGEWMSIKVFSNENGQLTDVTDQFGLSDHKGWWNSIEKGDFNNDGFIDFVIGNHGLNSRFKATADKPITMYINDFDRNGTVEQILNVYNGDNAYPFVLKHDLEMQMPSLKKKYLKYEGFKNQTLDSIFDITLLEKSTKLETNYLKSCVLLSKDGQGYEVIELPVEAQFSPIYGLVVNDFDGDGNQDILAGGNLFDAKPEVGIYDASYGHYLKGDGKGGFVAVSSKSSGFKVRGQVRDMITIKVKDQNYIVISRNDDEVRVVQLGG